MILSNEVECDEAYVITGHKGQPAVVKYKGRTGRRRRRTGKGGRGMMEKERPPVLGMMERGGQVLIHLLANVKQKTIEPLMKDTIKSVTQMLQAPAECHRPPGLTAQRNLIMLGSTFGRGEA